MAWEEEGRIQRCQSGRGVEISILKRDQDLYIIGVWHTTPGTGYVTVIFGRISCAEVC